MPAPAPENPGTLPAARSCPTVRFTATAATADELVKQVAVHAAHDYLVMFRHDRLVMHVRIVAAKPGCPLHEATLRVDHQLPVTAIPQIVAVGERAGDAAAVGLYRVFAEELRIERRQLAVPEDDPG